MTDHYQPYEAFIPKERSTHNRKAETFTVEGLQQPISSLPGKNEKEVKVL